MNLSNTEALMLRLKSTLRLFILLSLFACAGRAEQGAVHTTSDAAIEKAKEDPPETVLSTPVIPAADRMEAYLPLLEGKRIAVVANQTSLVGEAHLVDTLIARGVDVAHAYAPEHGFRGAQGAGDHIDDERDERTGLLFYSLHGKTKKPSQESLQGIDLVLFDIQDVGARFYTYISTLHYVMEACAEAGVQVMVLDRPNPHGHYIDGPILEEAHSSFIGMHPVPVIYGMTIGEYAQMINGEGWLEGPQRVDLEVIPLSGYSHSSHYELPEAPSPNLPTASSIKLYPSLCFLEGTVVSVGRGTKQPFETYGHPELNSGTYTYTPESNAAARFPKLEGEVCKGFVLDADEVERVHSAGKLELSYILNSYKELDQGDAFFRSDGFFTLLAGTEQLREQIQAGMTEMEIRATWKEGLDAFSKKREHYLLYD